MDAIQLKENTVERLQTRIDMIRDESRTLSHRIAIMGNRRSNAHKGRHSP